MNSPLSKLTRARLCVSRLNTRAFCRLFLLPGIFLALSGCFGTEHLSSMDRNTERLANELEKDHAHLKGVDESTKRLANELETDRQYIELLTVQLTKMSEAIQSMSKLGQDTISVLMNKIFNAGPDGKGAPASADETPDLDDILGGPSIGPSPPAPALPTSPPSLEDITPPVTEPPTQSTENLQ